MHEISQDGSEEKRHSIHNPECKGSFKQRARTARALAHERAKAVVEGTGAEVGARGLGDVAQLVDTCDECPEEAEINEANKVARAFGAAMTDKGIEGPDRS